MSCTHPTMSGMRPEGEDAANKKCYEGGLPWAGAKARFDDLDVILYGANEKGGRRRVYSKDAGEGLGGQSVGMVS